MMSQKRGNGVRSSSRGYDGKWGEESQKVKGQLEMELWDEAGEVDLGDNWGQWSESLVDIG